MLGGGTLNFSLRDVALNFCPSGNITADKRLRNLAGFSVQICFANFFYPQTLDAILISALRVAKEKAGKMPTSFILVGRAGFEPATVCLKGNCSTRLS